MVSTPWRLALVEALGGKVLDDEWPVLAEDECSEVVVVVELGALMRCTLMRCEDSVRPRGLQWSCRVCSDLQTRLDHHRGPFVRAL